MRATQHSDMTDKPKNIRTSFLMKSQHRANETPNKHHDMLESTTESAHDTKKRHTKARLDHQYHDHEDAVLIDDNSSNDSSKKIFGGGGIGKPEVIFLQDPNCIEDLKRIK